MFLHIGGSQIVFFKDLIGIFNLDRADHDSSDHCGNSNSPEIIKVGSNAECFKSLIVTDSNVYISPISSLTLSRRRNASS
jgi:extracellular matrix regulatory protein B